MATSPADPRAPRTEDPSRPPGVRRRRAARLAAVLAAASAALALRSPALQPPARQVAAAPAPPAAAPAPQDMPAEKMFKDIKVLQGVPASQMAAVMHVMRASLGVRCDYCHDLEHYEADNPAKETSREMVRMVFEINKGHFGGTTEVTCQTCHHGQVHPSRAPAMELGFILGPIPPPKVAKLPTAAEVLDRYIAALGGRAALAAVRSRVSRGTLLHLQVVGAGTPQVHGVNRGQEDPLEIVERLPDKTVMTYGPPGDQVVETFDGATATVRSAQGVRALPPEEATQVAQRFGLRRELALRDRADRARVVGRDRIDGRDVYLLRTTAPDGNPALLSFDVETGLLRRQAVYRPTVVGPDPEQTDLEDYRDVGGVKVPFRVKLSLLDDFHYGTTRKLTEVRVN